MSMFYRTALVTALSAYFVVSPFLFLWFHRSILGEVWDNDLADRVTVRLYVISNIAAAYMAYIVEECGKTCPS